MEHTIKFDMMVADLIVQEASSHFTFSIPLEDECVTKNLSSTSSIQYDIAKNLGMSDASQVQVEQFYVPLQEMVWWKTSRLARLIKVEPLKKELVQKKQQLLIHNMS